MVPLSYRRHRFPPAIIQHAIWLYLRFTLSYRDVEDLLVELLDDPEVGGQFMQPLKMQGVVDVLQRPIGIVNLADPGRLFAAPLS
jgi:hypothetical protein